MDLISTYVISNIYFNVIDKKHRKLIKIIVKMILVFGCFSKFRNGPIIVSINPITEDMKNLGNRKTFSQKSGIIVLFLSLVASAIISISILFFK